MIGAGGRAMAWCHWTIDTDLIQSWTGSIMPEPTRETTSDTAIADITPCIDTIATQ